jgi:hypothetical protein
MSTARLFALHALIVGAFLSFLTFAVMLFVGWLFALFGLMSFQTVLLTGATGVVAGTVCVLTLILFFPARL